MATGNLETTLLLQQLQLGSEQAFSKIYDLYSKRLYRNILFLVKDDDVAEEILQDVFLNLWVKREQINPDKKWLSYLFETARRQVLTHYGKVAKNQRIIDHLIITTVDHVGNAEDMLIDQETHALLTRAIEKMPPQRKQVFKLCKLDGKSYKEVSDLLGISTNTISNQIKAANKSLKEFFLMENNLAVLFIVSNASFLIVQHTQYLL